MNRNLIAFVLFAFACAPFVATLAQETPKLGLAERRAIKQYKETKWPELKKAIDEAAAFEVTMDVKWEVLAKPGEADKYSEDGYWTDIYFKPLIEALKTITADQEGKDALKMTLKQIVVTFDDKTAPSSNYATGVTFKEGVLTVNFRPWSNTADVKDRMAAIKSTLENGL